MPDEDRDELLLRFWLDPGSLENVLGSNETRRGCRTEKLFGCQSLEVIVALAITGSVVFVDAGIEREMRSKFSRSDSRVDMVFGGRGVPESLRDNRDLFRTKLG